MHDGAVKLHAVVQQQRAQCWVTRPSCYVALSAEDGIGEGGIVPAALAAAAEELDPEPEAAAAAVAALPPEDVVAAALLAADPPPGVQQPVSKPATAVNVVCGESTLLDIASGACLLPAATHAAYTVPNKTNKSIS